MKKLIFLLASILPLVFPALVIGCSSQSSSLKSQNLIAGDITVQALSYYDLPFSITSKMQNATVSGSFQVTTGAIKNIETYILTDAAYTTWTSGRQVNTLYNSGRVTEAKIDVPITSTGKYHIVFTNTFSEFSSKQISANITLQWYAPK